jgi:hypothetical protein
MVQETGAEIHTDIGNILEAACSGHDVQELLAAYEEAKQRFDALARTKSLIYGEIFGVEALSAALLYCLVVCLRPEHFVETGVADGVSSWFILDAMRRNGFGTLHSIDIRSNVGALVDERDGWDLIILDRARPKASLAEHISAFPGIDMFLHDSRHSADWQRYEFDLAVRSGARWLLCDDADATYAFQRFCKERDLRPMLIFDRLKIFGVVKLQ